MSRKNIFEILAENNNIEKDIERINNLFKSEPLLIDNRNYDSENYSLKRFVDYFCFEEWKSRGHCINLDDFLKSVEYNSYYQSAKTGNVEAFFIIIEIVFNCWKMTDLYMTAKNGIKYYINFNLLFDIMTECLSQYNHEAVYDENSEQILVIEKNPAATAVAEIVEDDLSILTLRYNHHTLKGNLDSKKSILLALGSALEPKRKQLSKINSTLEDGIFFMLNNLNMRHNNISPTNKNYRAFVAQMDDETLEEWYDELYQMILLAFLDIDQLERNEKVKALKTSINGGTN